MPLIQADLGDALAAIFANYPASPEACALAMADAYIDYASSGAFGASVPVLTGDHRDALADVLLVAIELPALGLPATIAAAWAAGLAALWAAVPVVGLQIGATAGCPGAGSIIGSLTAVYANLANTAQTCGDGTAAALHSATLTVTANVAPPPSPVPIG